MNQMNGKIVLITGGTDGIGRQCALELGAAGALVLLHARDFESGVATLQQLRDKLPTACFDLFVANFEERHQIERAAHDVKSAYPKIDVLINNESVYMQERQLTGGKIEKTFAVNHLAPFLFTDLLLPLLKNAGKARIINVSSHAHYIAQFDADNLQGEKSFNGTKAFSRSKLCNLLFTYALAEKLKGQQISVNAVHPGWLQATRRDGLFGQLPGQTDEDGADTIVYLASATDVAELSGMYFMSRLPVQSSYASYNRKNQRLLWTISERLAMINSCISLSGNRAPSPSIAAGMRFVQTFRNAVLKIKGMFGKQASTSTFYYQENR